MGYDRAKILQTFCRNLKALPDYGEEICLKAKITVDTKTERGSW